MRGRGNEPQKVTTKKTRRVQSHMTLIRVRIVLRYAFVHQLTIVFRIVCGDCEVPDRNRGPCYELRLPGSAIPIVARWRHRVNRGVRGIAAVVPALRATRRIRIGSGCVVFQERRNFVRIFNGDALHIESNFPSGRVCGITHRVA